MTRIKLLALGTMTTLMILGSSMVVAAPAADDLAADPTTDRAAAVQATVQNVIGGGAGRYLPK